MTLAGCSAGDDGTLDIAIIGSSDSVFTDGLRLSPGAQHVRAATESGLVALNPQGAVVPALAETWLPQDDGLSFFFRLRSTTWPDGSPLSAESVAAALNRAIADLDGTSLGRDLEVVEDVRAMAGRVIEIRLSTPEPYLLQLLAQPELALRTLEGGTGPMVMEREGEAGAILELKSPEERGLPMDEDWQDGVRTIAVQVTIAEEGIAMFEAGEAEVVLGGTLGNFPLVDIGPLSTATLRIGTSVGLFGLRIRSEEGLLRNSSVREGLAMALDREALMASFNLGGWIATTRPVQPGLPDDPGLVAERWQDIPIEELREEAAARISAWRAQFGEGDTSQPAVLTIAIPEGPGWEAFLDNLAQQYATVGIRLERAENGASADMVLVDRIARYPAPRWFLNQFHCSLGRPCSEIADLKVDEALRQDDPVQRARMLAEAEADLTLENIYIPIGVPVRWSLARGSVDGLVANPYGFHPLPPLAEIPR